MNNAQTSLCDHCLSFLVGRLTKADAMALAVLQDTTYIESMNYREFLNLVMEMDTPKGTKQTKNQIYTSIFKLEALMFIDHQRRSQANYYYITENGRRAVAYLCNVLKK